ncbi:MAG: polysaccharide biosynthesis protein, partial [[Clostridium] aminophilum]|nr:polysaccharide biosynthesis protein [[Clostridium] aminophilum]
MKLQHWQIIEIMLMIYDIVVITASFFAALLLRFDGRYSLIPKRYIASYYKTILVYAVLSIIVFWCVRLYHSIWRFASYVELIRISAATAITFFLQMAVTLA